MDYDVIIIGGGPSGLTAGIYTSRARLKALLIESFSITPQAALTDLIENYPGFPDGISGFELMDKFKTQAQKFGLEFIASHVTGIKEYKDNSLSGWRIDTEDKTYTALSVIIASGARPKRLAVPGEGRLTGKGVSYCATCDGPIFKDKIVSVIGGGDSAIEEALFLTKFVNKVTIIHRRSVLRAAKILEERAFGNKKISFIWDSVVSEILGDTKVKAIKIKNVKTEKESELNCDGVFIFVGYAPNTDFVKGLLELDEDGYIIEGSGSFLTPHPEERSDEGSLKILQPFGLQDEPSGKNKEKNSPRAHIITDGDTNTLKPGIFTCGDCRKKLLKQVVTACGDGANAAFMCRRYIEEFIK